MLSSFAYRLIVYRLRTHLASRHLKHSFDSIFSWRLSNKSGEAGLTHVALIIYVRTLAENEDDVFPKISIPDSY